jgi:hypothetical protein
VQVESRTVLLNGLAKLGDCRVLELDSQDADAANQLGLIDSERGGGFLKHLKDCIVPSFHMQPSRLVRSEQKLVEEMFEPLRVVERKMGVNEKVWTKQQFTLDQVDFLNRSEHYPEWRRVIADIFSRLNPLLDEEVVRAGHPRLVIVTCPAELPVGPDRMWMRFKKHGKMVRLDLRAGDDEDFLPRLLTGDNRSARQKTLPELYAARKANSPHDAWMVEAGRALSPLTTPAPTGLVKLSYEALQGYRARLMKEVDKVLKTQDIPGPRQLGAKLKQLRVLPSENEAASDQALAEFMRSVLLSGNGTLLINNTFVEWATVQAVRRANLRSQ